MKVQLVIPCFNEKLRLPTEKFLAAAGIEFIFVDDGSTDGTADFLKHQFRSLSNFQILELPQNQGKSEAVRHGILKALESPGADWIGFWDADLATPLSEVPHFITYAQTFYQNPKSIWGSRLYRLGSDIKRSAKRHYLGRVFATMIAEILGVEAYDTQCGAKLFKPELAAKVFAEPFISRWIFDVEILLRMNQKDVVEYPLQQWHDVPGSKVKIARESWRVFRDILAIRKKYLN